MRLEAINVAISHRQRLVPSRYNWIAGSRGWLSLLTQPGEARDGSVFWAHNANQSDAHSSVIITPVSNRIRDPFVIHMEEGHD